MLARTDPVVVWLLEAGDPAVRALTRRDLLGRPSSREAALSSPLVRALLTDPSRTHPYAKWSGAHWRLVSLVELGVPAGQPEAVAACDSVLTHWARRERLSQVPVVGGRARRCASQEGNAVAVASRLGLARDQRVALLVEHLLAWQWPDGGWNCDPRPEARHSSFHETLPALWGLHVDGRKELGPHPLLLVVGASEVEYKNLLAQYHALCARLGPLPPPRVINVDHGAQRFLLFALDRKAANGPCTTPAMAWIDAPVNGDRVEKVFDVAGWAFKDGVGLKQVEVMLDGKVVAAAEYGKLDAGPERFWPISNDPHHPHVGFSARVDASGFAKGRHWLGLRLHGSDGSVEDWSEQPVQID